MRYNFLQKIIAATLLFLSLSLPTLVFSESASPTPNIGKGICDQIADLSINKIALANEKQVNFETQYDIEIKKQGDLELSADQKLKEERDSAEGTFLANINTFTLEASSTEQKQAITHFQDTIESARNMRLIAIDNAVKTFRDGVASSTEIRKVGVENALSHFQDSIKTAFAKAVSDCANSVPPQTIRANLRLAITSAQDRLIAEKLSITKTGVAVDSLAKTRRDSIKKAIADYKVVIRKAKADLRLLFPTVKK